MKNTLQLLLALTVVLLTDMAVSAQGLNCSEAEGIECGQTISGNTAGTPPDGVTTGNFEGTGGQHWYRFTAPANGSVTLSLCNPATTYDSRIHVYTGDCAPFIFVGQDDDACITPGLASELTWAVTIGVTYYIRVGGFSGGSGPYQGLFSCNLEILGCTEPTACNYNPDAVQDDGTCDFDTCYGCTYAQALNFDPAAIYDDGTCQFNVVANGCTDPGACNYCSLCQGDDGTCDYGCLGCIYPDASNYDPAATRDDGSCIFPGCTDVNAYNYNPLAVVDDGSCDYAGNCFGDFNQDGVVGVADVLLFIQAFGGTCN